MRTISAGQILFTGRNLQPRFTPRSTGRDAVDWARQNKIRVTAPVGDDNAAGSRKLYLKPNSEPITISSLHRTLPVDVINLLNRADKEKIRACHQLRP